MTDKSVTRSGKVKQASYEGAGVNYFSAHVPATFYRVKCRQDGRHFTSMKWPGEISSR